MIDEQIAELEGLCEGPIIGPSINRWLAAFNALPGLLAEWKRLRAALRTYGDHLPRCRLKRWGHETTLAGDVPKCTCGLDAALSGEKG